MRLPSFFGRESRASVEDPRVPISSQKILEFFGFDALSGAGQRVTIDRALGVPAIWAAVNFLSGTLAGLPLNLYQRNGEAREQVRGGLATILHDAVNEETSSFDWRKYKFEQVFSEGRSVTFIERNASKEVINLWPLETPALTIKRINGRRVYKYKDGISNHTYLASEVIDLAFMLKRDRLKHRSPIMSNKDVVGLALAATAYGSKFFNNGGVPPFVIEGPFQSPGGLQRAADDMARAVADAAVKERLALSIPAGHSVKSLGIDLEKAQLVQLHRFLIEQFARIWSLPPTFLQDLTHGTFSNTEQQDLHFVKHTLKRWVEQFEQELNLKLFGRANNDLYVEMNIDGLLRGDFKARMEGYGQAIQNGVIMPNEARRRENLPDDAAGNSLMINAATVPLSSQPTAPREDDTGADDNADSN